MNRIITVAALSAAALASMAPAAWAHKADPDYLTEVRAIEPATEGITVTVVNRSDQLLLQNTSGTDVVVHGYEKEAYARVLADRTVQVNTNSPAFYLNEDRYGTTKPPAGVTASSPPKWKTLDRSGRFAWHDHRMHWMGKGRPPQVKDPGVRTRIYDWSVPIEVGSETGAVSGTLWWTPAPGGGVPLGAIIVGAALVMALSVMVIVVRRRRAAAPPAASGEAW
jgi:hypothetical protein